MASWSLLDEKEENELHKSRLLNVEEKPFKRITKRLLSLNSIVASTARQAPTPPPESGDVAGAEDQATAATQSQESALAAAASVRDMKEDIVLDFAAFDGTIARLQFLLTANERERARYAADRVRILDTSQAVRADTARLRDRLEEARAALAQRKRFDELAERITSNRMLRPREDQAANLRKLEEECAQLEAESEAYAATWRERREQFSRIMDESMRLRRLIRDEKEEVERREGMDGDEGSAEGGGGAGGGGSSGIDSVHTPRPGVASGNATPHPEGSGDGGAPKTATAGQESADGAAGLTASRAASTAGGRTPARDSPGPGGGSQPSLKAAGTQGDGRSASPAAHGSAVGSRSVSPHPAAAVANEGEGPEEGEDVEMGDESKGLADSSLTPVQGTDTPRIVVDNDDTDDKMDTT